MTDQPGKHITIDAPSELTILAARHLDATEGRVQVGATVDSATRAAITQVLRYVSTAHNSPTVPDLEGQLDAAYRERAHLVAWLAALHPAVIAPSLDIDDEDDWQLLFINADGQQLSWHISPRDTALFEHVEHVDFADPRAQWDGHTTDEKYQRIRQLAALAGSRPSSHVYLSTGCFHGDHDYCKSMTGLNGAKRPASCKKCGAKCICSCHDTEGTDTTLVEPLATHSCGQEPHTVNCVTTAVTNQAGQPITEREAAAVRAANLPSGTRVTRTVVDQLLRQDTPGMSRAEEDEAATAYEQAVRRVESSGPRPAATQATDGWTQQDDGTWTLPIEGGTVLFTRRSTPEERARFATAWAQNHSPKEPTP